MSFFHIILVTTGEYKEYTISNYIRFYIFAAVKIHIVVFWLITPCSLADGYNSCCGWWHELRINIPLFSAESETLTSLFSECCTRKVKQIGLLPGFVQTKLSGNRERYPHHSTTSPLLLSCMTICHHLCCDVYQCFRGTCHLHHPWRLQYGSRIRFAK
jgi:hypothetical protein